MTDDNLLPFSFPAVSRKQISAAFDGGRLTSDGGVMVLAMAERRLGVADRLARCFPDRRDPTRITHAAADMIRARIFAISCGYEDADDLDFLRADPAFKLACGKLPDTGSNLCSQPTLSRLENAPSLKDAIRLTWALVDQDGDPHAARLRRRLSRSRSIPQSARSTQSARIMNAGASPHSSVPFPPARLQKLRPAKRSKIRQMAFARDQETCRPPKIATAGE